MPRNERSSSDMVLHRIRWYARIERGEREFKCNNNWTSALARWAMSVDPDLLGFFELRECRNPVDIMEIPKEVRDLFLKFAREARHAETSRRWNGRPVAMPR